MSSSRYPELMSPIESSKLVASSPPDPLSGSDMTYWSLSRDMTFLNHGSFGARPKDIVQAQLDLKRRLDDDPADILWVRGESLLEEATAQLAGFLQVSPDDLVSVVNATQAVNAVARALDLQPGQNIIATNHGYNAVNQTLRYVAERVGATLRLIDLEQSLSDEAVLIEAFESAMDDQTALVMLDHVSSPTALLFPVHEIVRRCRERGIRIMVDGAHAPGMLDLDITSIGADFYTGNLHKWVSAPLGAAFLHVRPEHHAAVHPASISHYLGEGFQKEFSWTGTCDPSSYLTAPAAIAWFAERFGWSSVREHNCQLVAWATGRLCDAWSVDPLDVPEASRLTSMRTIELPPRLRNHFDVVEDWRHWLRDEHAFDVAVHDWGGRWWIRLSAHVYNRPEEYERLIKVGLKGY